MNTREHHAIAYLGLPRDNRDGGSPWFEVKVWFGEPATLGTEIPRASR